MPLIPRTRENTLAIVMSYPDDSISIQLAQWLYRTADPASAIIGVRGSDLAKREDVVSARNETVKRIILGSHRTFEYSLWCDRDIRPDARTQPFLAAQGPVVACYHDLPDMSTWAHPNSLHMGLVIVHRSVFESIEPPWFGFDYSDDGCQLLSCECNHFARQVVSAGFTIIREGWAGHWHLRPGDVR